MVTYNREPAREKGKKALLNSLNSIRIKGTTDWFQIGEGVCQGCILSPCLFNFYAEHIMRNAGLEKSQAGIKIAGRNLNNLRYALEKAMAPHSSTLAW